MTDISGITKGRHSDVILIAEGEHIPASRRHLKRTSAYFRAMFRSRMRESFSPEVTIHGVPGWVLRSLVEFSYTRRVRLTMRRVYELLAAACMLQFRSVTRACVNYLLQHMSVNTCLNIMFIAEAHGLTSLFHSAQRMALWHFVTVTDQAEFWRLPEEALRGYLSHDMLNVTSEQDVVSALYKWVAYNSVDRLAHLPRILACTRLCCLSEDKLQELLTHDFTKSSPESMELIKDVQKCKAGDERLAATLPKNHFTPRSIEKELWLVGRDVIRPGKQIPDFAMMHFDIKSKLVTPVNKGKPMPASPRGKCYGYRCCLVGKDLYACGGEVYLGRSNWLRDVWKFDTFTQSWEVVSQIPQARRHHSMVAMKTDLYLIGGFGRHRIMLDSVEKFDTVSGEWSEIPKMKRAVYSAATCCHDDRVYVVKNLIQCYSPGDPTWTQLTVSLPFDIRSCVSSSHTHTLYLLAQYEGGLLALDLRDLTLTELGQFKEPCGAAVLINDVIYALGDEEGEEGGDSQCLHSYHLQKVQFSIECRLEAPLYYHFIMAVPSFPGYHH